MINAVESGASECALSGSPVSLGHHDDAVSWWVVPPFDDLCCSSMARSRNFVPISPVFFWCNFSWFVVHAPSSAMIARVATLLPPRRRFSIWSPWVEIAANGPSNFCVGCMQLRNLSKISTDGNATQTVRFSKIVHRIAKFDIFLLARNARSSKICTITKKKQRYCREYPTHGIGDFNVMMTNGAVQSVYVQYTKCFICMRASIRRKCSNAPTLSWNEITNAIDRREQEHN